jgi:hypothetical protein
MQFSTWMTICLLWASSAALFGIPSSDSHGPPKGPWRALAVGLAIVAAMNVILALVAPDAEPRVRFAVAKRILVVLGSIIALGLSALIAIS